LNITVSNGGNVLGSDPFRVNRVPKPSLEVRVNGAVFDERRGIAASAARSIQVIAVPDESFKNFSPQDARFRVSQIEVSLARGTRRINGVTLNGGGSISSLAQQAQPGDRYVITVLKVERQNFKGAVSEVEMGNQYRTVPLN
jgi:hypothetical protein